MIVRSVVEGENKNIQDGTHLPSHFTIGTYITSLNFQVEVNMRATCTSVFFQNK